MYETIFLYYTITNEPLKKCLKDVQDYTNLLNSNKCFNNLATLLQW